MTVVILINIFVCLIKSQLINKALFNSKTFLISFFNLNEDNVPNYLFKCHFWKYWHNVSNINHSLHLNWYCWLRNMEYSISFCKNELTSIWNKASRYQPWRNTLVTAKMYGYAYAKTYRRYKTVYWFQ